jgi:uncharacterized RDD family membrane protein YckC
MALRLQVVSAGGTPVTRPQAWIRAGFRFATGLLFIMSIVSKLMPAIALGVWLIDYLPGLITPQRTTLHDLIARTRVIRLE